MKFRFFKSIFLLLTFCIGAATMSASSVNDVSSNKSDKANGINSQVLFSSLKGAAAAGATLLGSAGIVTLVLLKQNSVKANPVVPTRNEGGKGSNENDHGKKDEGNSGKDTNKGCNEDNKKNDEGTQKDEKGGESDNNSGDNTDKSKEKDNNNNNNNGNGGNGQLGEEDVISKEEQGGNLVRVVAIFVPIICIICFLIWLFIRDRKRAATERISKAQDSSVGITLDDILGLKDGVPDLENGQKVSGFRVLGPKGDKSVMNIAGFYGKGYCVVNAANYHLGGGSGVDQAVHEYFGDEHFEAITKMAYIKMYCKEQWKNYLEKKMKDGKIDAKYRSAKYYDKIIKSEKIEINLKVASPLYTKVDGTESTGKSDKVLNRKGETIQVVGPDLREIVNDDDDENKMFKRLGGDRERVLNALNGKSVEKGGDPDYINIKVLSKKKKLKYKIRNPAKGARDQLYSCYVNVLNCAKEHGIKKIVFPCISTGSYCYPKKEAAIISVKAIKNWISKNPDYPMDIVICCYNKEQFGYYEGLFKDKVSEDDAVDKIGSVKSEMIDVVNTSFASGFSDINVGGLV